MPNPYIKVYLKNAQVVTDTSDGYIEPIRGTFPLGYMSAATGSTADMVNRSIGSQSLPWADYSLFQNESGVVLGASRAAVITSLNGMLESTLEITDFIKGDTTAGKTEDTQFVHNGDITQGGAVVLDTTSALLGFQSGTNFKAINNTVSAVDYGELSLNVDDGSGGEVEAVKIQQGNVFGQPAANFNFSSLNITGDTGFTTASGTTTFSGDTSGIDYNDLSNQPTLGIADVVSDTTPQLGGSLDVNGNSITSSSNGNITIDPAGTGAIILKSSDIRFEDAGTINTASIKLREGSLFGTNAITLTAPLALASDITYVLPAAYGAMGQVVYQTNAGGTLGFKSVVDQSNGVVKGALSISPTSPGVGSDPSLFIKNLADTYGVMLKVPSSIGANETYYLPAEDGTSGQAMTTDGSGNLSFSTISGGSSAPIPVTKVSGRWQWSSSDDGERVFTGNTSYGPYNFYSHTSEPSNSTLRAYSAAHAVGTTTATTQPYKLAGHGIPIHVTDKKVRVDFRFRVQNAPSGSGWGISLWGADFPTSLGSTTNETVTLRGLSSTVTTTTTSSVGVYTGSFTTTAAFTEDTLMVLMENRTGSLTSTTYMYGQFSVYLVD